MEKFADLIVNTLELPSEILSDMPLLTLKGNQNVTIENYIKLVNFSDNNVSLLTGQGILNINGSNLQIACIYQGQIRLTGLINAIILEAENV